jgi:hypothetical protein
MQEETNALIPSNDGNRELIKDAGKEIASRFPAQLAKRTTDIEVDISRAERLPLSELTSLGVGFCIAAQGGPHRHDYNSGRRWPAPHRDGQLGQAA